MCIRDRLSKSKNFKNLKVLKISKMSMGDEEFQLIMNSNSLKQLNEYWNEAKNKEKNI